MSTSEPNNLTSPYPRILAGLAKVERRLRIAEAARLAPWSVAAALAAGVALGIVDRFWPLLPWAEMLLLDAGLVLLALLGVALYSWLRPRRRIEVARRGDGVLEMDERLSTAVEAQEAPKAMRLSPADAEAYQALKRAQLEDAAALLDDALPSLPRAMPLSPPRRGLVVPGVLALLLMLSFVAPNPATAFFEQQAAVGEQQKEEAQKIEELRKDLDALAQDPAVAALEAELAALEEALAGGEMSREEAVARLSEAESKLQQLIDKQAPGSRAALDSLARQLGEQQGALGRAGEALRNGDAAKAAEEIGKAGDELSRMSPEERAGLAEELRKAAEEVANNDPALAGRLNDLAQALQSGDQATTQQALDNLADQVRQTGQNLATQDQLNRALSQIQDSKQNIAGAGGTPMAGGTPLAGTPIAPQGTPVVISGTLTAGTPVAISGTPITGTLSMTGTPVIATGQGPPVVAPGQGNGNQPGSGNSAGGNQAGRGHREPVAVPPSTLNAQGTPVGVQARPGEGDTSVTGVNTNPAGGSSSVPYDDVYTTYNQNAQQTLEGDYIPAGMKDLVRRYFTAIEPEE